MIQEGANATRNTGQRLSGMGNWEEENGWTDGRKERKGTKKKHTISTRLQVIVCETVHGKFLFHILEQFCTGALEGIALPVVKGKTAHTE